MILFTGKIACWIQIFKYFASVLVHHYKYLFVSKLSIVSVLIVFYTTSLIDILPIAAVGLFCNFRSLLGLR